jgi:predicted acylesterase/phospholipase RssA
VRTASLLRLVLGGLFALSLSACAAWPERPTVTANDQALARVGGFGDIRLWVDAEAQTWLEWREAYLSDRSEAGRRDSLEMLAISSGSDKGAFSAGFLKGWSATGTRPTFDVVSGVSTGALIAPFAFLGSGYDPHIEHLYTTIDAHSIYRAAPLKGLLGGPSLASTEPLANLIETYADAALIDAVAREHRLGRRLLVQTTNLDAERGMVWDMGAIAASENPARYALFRQILLASASIPGFFPPVLIDVDNNGVEFSELHVDGGTTSSILAVPPSVLFSNGNDRSMADGRVTVLYNGDLEPVFRVSEPTVFAILERALTISLKAADQRTIRALQQYAEQNELALDIHSVGKEASNPDVDLFDQQYMQGLFALGEERAASVFAQE